MNLHFEKFKQELFFMVISFDKDMVNLIGFSSLNVFFIFITATGMANPAAVGGQVAVSTASAVASMASAASMASMTNSAAASQQALLAMAAQQAAAASAFTGGASAAGINAELLAAMGQYQQYQKTLQQQQQQQLNQQTFGKMDMS